MLSRSSSIKDGSHNFKRRFIEISRAGNRLVSVDQSLLLHHNEMQRAAIRNNFSETLLLKLHQAKIQNTGQELQTNSDSESDSDSEEEAKGDGGNRDSKFEEEDMSAAKSNLSSFYTQSEDLDNPHLVTSRMDLYNVDTELALIVGKKISYQAGSQGYKFYLPPEEKKSTIHDGTYIIALTPSFFFMCAIIHHFILVCTWQNFIPTDPQSVPVKNIFPQRPKCLQTC